jgi:site-specific recombinase XerD
MRAKTNLSVADVARIIDASSGVTRVIVEVLYSSGARVSELCKLTWDDIDFGERTIRLMGKGADERLVPLGSPCIAALRAMPGDRGGAVFSMSDQNIRDRLTILGKRIGLHLYPHLFRHAFATHLHSNGANERVVQDLLGHRRVDTTMLYLDTSDRTLQESKDLITRCLAAARGQDADPRSLKRVIAGHRATLVLR